MKLRMRLRNEGNDYPRYHKDLELPFLPPEGMWLQLGEMPNDGEIMAGSVTDLEHDFRTGVTGFTCDINDSDTVMDTFARLDGWNTGSG